MKDSQAGRKHLYFNLWKAYTDFLEAGGTIPEPRYGMPQFVGSGSASELRDIVMTTFGVEVSGKWIKEFRDSLQTRGETNTKIRVDRVVEQSVPEVGNERAIIDAVIGPPGKVSYFSCTIEGLSPVDKPAFLNVTVTEDTMYRVKMDTDMAWFPDHMSPFSLNELLVLFRDLETLRYGPMKKVGDQVYVVLPQKGGTWSYAGFTIEHKKGVFTLKDGITLLMSSETPSDIHRCFGFMFTPRYVKARLASIMTDAKRSG